MRNYKDLEIYRISYELAAKTHRFSLTLDQYELYEKGSQVRRSSKGLTSCIVEGYGRRKYKAEFIKFLISAHASCDETILHLRLLRDTHKYCEVGADELISAYEELGEKINRFIKLLEKDWNVRAKE